jgi:hypothetical protein
MRVVFTSDSSINYDGFTASWNSVCICTPGSPVQASLKDELLV